VGVDKMNRIIENVNNSLEQEKQKLQNYIDDTFKFKTQVDIDEFTIGNSTIQFSLIIFDETGITETFEVTYENYKYSLYKSSYDIDTDIEQILKKYYGIEQ
jgi:malate synthase